MEQPAPTFLGYLAREIYTMREYLARVPDQAEAARGIHEICSVSACISEAHRDYQRWLFNPSGCYSSPELALEAVSAERRQAARVFGYSLFPLEFEGPGVLPVRVESLLGCKPDELPDFGPEPDFVPLGYDAVTMRPNREGCMFAFDCSPLSCNNEFVGRCVNVSCLLDDWEEAVSAAQVFAQEEPEPGPYCIVQVFERRPSA